MKINYTTGVDENQPISLTKILYSNRNHPFLLWSADAPYIFLCRSSRKHDLMTTAHALQPEVHTDPQDLPLMAAAGVRLLHFNNITDLNIQGNTSDL